MDNRVVAIDGPAGAGKSTIAKLLADRIKYTYIDSGAMYRALTLKVLESSINIADTKEIIDISKEVDIDFLDKCIYLDGKVVDKQIREERINKNVSIVAAIPEVRKNIVRIQRKISIGKNVVMDGRDVGTVIFPHAFIKFFITASIEERAMRRYAEIEASGMSVNLHDIKSQIEKRDYTDSTREDSPLLQAADAILIDTSGKSIEEVLQVVINFISLRGGDIDAV
ncbi:MAG TPA: (d)CMP kinase [Patescibacteria group bacterium]|nr:(d)CMP kinase [Patescibacteria group bacterium]